jgi:hypothetical protein
MTVEEIDIIANKLKELKKLLPDDVYISELYDSMFSKKLKAEKETLNIIPTNKERGKYFIALRRKLQTHDFDMKVLRKDWMSLYVVNKELFNRKIMLMRRVEKCWQYNHLELEANNIINTLIWKDFLNQLPTLKK